MKVTVVPAQVTTIEDRIAGNLGVSQLLLLATPIFLGSAAFAVLPPFFHNAVYKFVLIGVLFIVCCLLAIRIKGTIVLFWAVTLLRYNRRPRFYVFDKNSSFNRQDYPLARVAPEKIEAIKKIPSKPVTKLTPNELIKLQEFITNPSANVHFVTKKGNLYVRVTQVG